MVGSIDPRCETIRGTHWHKTGRVVVWNLRRGSHLGQRSKPTASTGRTYGCKRSDQTRKNSCGTGAVHIWVPALRAKCAWPGRRWIDLLDRGGSEAQTSPRVVPANAGTQPQAFAVTSAVAPAMPDRSAGSYGSRLCARRALGRDDDRTKPQSRGRRCRRSC